MKGKNKVFIATSIDGIIADAQGKIDWLHAIPNPENVDMGYSVFMNSIDAIVMGRNTFETVLNFGIDWPYEVPVFVLSDQLKQIPEAVQNKAVHILNGSPVEIVKDLNEKGFYELYIDGGKTIQNFLDHDLIDEMTITIIPILLGDGIPLFSHTGNRLKFKCVETKIFLEAIVQNKFVKERGKRY